MVPPFVTSVAAYSAAAGRLMSSAAKTSDRMGVSSAGIGGDCSSPASTAFLKKIARGVLPRGQSACRVAGRRGPDYGAAHGEELRFLLRPGLALQLSRLHSARRH